MDGENNGKPYQNGMIWGENPVRVPGGSCFFFGAFDLSPRHRMERMKNLSERLRRVGMLQEAGQIKRHPFPKTGGNN